MRDIDGFTWLTVDEVAARVQVCRNTVLAVIWEGRLPAKKLTRGAWHVRDVDLVAWLATGDNLPKSTPRTADQR